MAALQNSSESLNFLRGFICKEKRNQPMLALRTGTIEKMKESVGGGAVRSETRSQLSNDHCTSWKRERREGKVAMEQQ
ncbi:hypothetical protein JCGZ_13585 [Jatropha curcas]|uniref:Uncharacterized protein n=1 Tax=Jatropha curcas TaxID=180498 RepID=A0A067KA25_JATCU|nr:hypothetical protein JCGZ_13585 [Jatropha curcas]